MKCVKCAKSIDKGDLFCGYCGTNQQKFSKYIEKVEKKIHKERDKEYDKKVNLAKKNLEILEFEREKEIKRITEGRWESCGKAPFKYNMTEGIIKINDETHLFSDIKGAEISKDDSYRVVTTEKGKSKKHVSLGKAVVGGALLGPLGAVAGGAMGKTTTSGKSFSDSIPTCSHIGVKVDIKGFTTEINVLNTTVDQSSIVYMNAIKEAQNIVDKLRKLASTPVPKSFLKPEEENTVKEIDVKLSEAKEELKKVTEDKPTYEIPESYFE